MRGNLGSIAPLPGCRRKPAPHPSASQTASSKGKAQLVEKLLGPLWEGAPPASGGGESFTQARRFRAKARLSPSGPSGHLPPRGRFFDTQSFSQGKNLYPGKCSTWNMYRGIFLYNPFFIPNFCAIIIPSGPVPPKKRKNRGGTAWQKSSQ